MMNRSQVIASLAAGLLFTCCWGCFHPHGYPGSGPRGNSTWQLPFGAIPRPNGSHLRAWRCAQSAKAQPMTYYLYTGEWVADTAELSADGQRRLLSCLERSNSIGPCTLIVESDRDHEYLDRQRLDATSEFIAQHAQGFPLEMVRLGSAPGDTVLGRRDLDQVSRRWDRVHADAAAGVTRRPQD